MASSFHYVCVYLGAAKVYDIMLFEMIKIGVLN